MKQSIRPGAYGVAVQDNHILLTTLKRGTFAGSLYLPGGGIEFGESPEEALKREFKEEVCFAFEEARLFDHYSLCYEKRSNPEKPSLEQMLCLVFLVSGLRSLPDLSPEETFDWYPLDNLPKDQLFPMVLQVVQKLKNEVPSSL